MTCESFVVQSVPPHLLLVCVLSLANGSAARATAQLEPHENATLLVQRSGLVLPHE